MDLTKREKIGICVFIVVIIAIMSLSYMRKNAMDGIQVVTKSEEETSIDKEQHTVSTQLQKDVSKTIKAYICGEVSKPGVYSLIDGDRLETLVELAGGFTTKADRECVNLAMVVKDEDFFKIPPIGAIVKGTPDIGGSIFSNYSSKKSGEEKININTASKEELIKLPRIGESMAQRIIDYREKNGGFTSIEDINNVSGIGDKIFQTIKDKIYVR